MRVRATLKLQNEKMISAKESLGLTLRELSERTGVPIGEICQFQRFDYTVPKAEEKAVRLAAALGVNVDDILPVDSVGRKIESTFVRKFDAEAHELSDLRNCRNVLPDPASVVEAGELREVLAERLSSVLSTLTFREREVIKLRYGIPDGQPHTLEEVARIFRVGRERVRQVEARAIRKLQHPVRAKRLESFLPSGAA